MNGESLIKWDSIGGRPQDWKRGERRKGKITTSFQCKLIDGRLGGYGRLRDWRVNE